MRRKTRKRETFTQLIFVQTFYNEKKQVEKQCKCECSCGGELDNEVSFKGLLKKES